MNKKILLISLIFTVLNFSLLAHSFSEEQRGRPQHVEYEDLLSYSENEGDIADYFATITISANPNATPLVEIVEKNDVVQKDEIVPEAGR